MAQAKPSRVGGGKGHPPRENLSSPSSGEASETGSDSQELDQLSQALGDPGSLQSLLLAQKK